jgi:ferredoxin
VEPFSKILLVGCNECVTVCAAGGAREVAVLASEIRLSRQAQGNPVEVRELTLERNCDPEYVEALKPFAHDYDVILSMACGCGVQFVTERLGTALVLPAVNTSFEGVTEEQGVWTERCQGCGNCMLHRTLGICPVTRCAKSIFNGPCGGSRDGSCEVNKDTPCAWHLIIERYKALNMMDRFLEIEPPRDWSTSRDGGPRKRVREDLRP